DDALEFPLECFGLPFTSARARRDALLEARAMPREAPGDVLARRRGEAERRRFLAQGRQCEFDAIAGDALPARQQGAHAVFEFDQSRARGRVGRGVDAIDAQLARAELDPARRRFGALEMQRARADVEVIAAACAAGL